MTAWRNRVIADAINARRCDVQMQATDSNYQQIASGRQVGRGRHAGVKSSIDGCRDRAAGQRVNRQLSSAATASA
ncbi:hypothetical protein XHV734_0256 [Xanthomonas hortorum pv. vitians]|nr:hypothetical protein XHV734_0256 [Xanthomonas hortorum pv. vitians]